MISEKWIKYTKEQQILMIANEINRAKNAILNNYNEDAKCCYERALELIVLTIDDLKWRNNLKEIIRCKEVVASLYIEMNINLNNLLYKCLIQLNSKAYNMLC